MIQMEPRKIEELLKSYLRENNLLQDEPRSWIVDCSSFGGRGIFATRDIEAGELIFTDVPLLIGPRCNNRLPMCVVCYKSECALFPCDHGCGLPICSTECENSAVHVQGECRFLREWAPTCGSTWSEDLLLAVVPIRSLTLSKEQCKLLYALKCHTNLTRNHEIDLLKRNVANLPSQKQIELMRHTCDVLNTNSFEVMVVSSQDEDCTRISLRGLYPIGALQNHCCVPNTRHHFDTQQRLHVSAALPITAGEEITMSYSDLLWDTWNRRQFLWFTKRFACNCNRCSDPLEFGSQLSALLCAKDDCSGHLLPRNPLIHASSWICDRCQIRMNHRQIETINSGLNTFVSKVMHKTPREILRFTETILPRLVPPTNYFMLSVKYLIISYFGRIPDLKWEDLTDAELRIKKMYCDDILSTLDILGSGDSIKKGLILYELYRTNLELFKRQTSNDKDEQTHPHIKNDDNEQLLRKAMSILQNDVGAVWVRKSD